MGLLMATPIGPVDLLCIRTALTAKLSGAVAAALGGCCADGLYAFLASRGLGMYANLLAAHTTLLTSIGGIFLCALALYQLLDKQPLTPPSSATTAPKRLLALAGQGLLLGLANPLSLITFSGAISHIIVGEQIIAVHALVMAVGIAFGSFSWWLFLSALARATKGKLSPRWLDRIQTISAVMLGALGLWTLLSALVRCI